MYEIVVDLEYEDGESVYRFADEWDVLSWLRSASDGQRVTVVSVNIIKDED